MTDYSFTNNLNEIKSALLKVQTGQLGASTPQELQEILAKIEALQVEHEPGLSQSRLAALYRISQTLGTSLDVDAVLNQVMDSVIELTGAERGFLMLLDPGSSQLELRAARNIERETLEQGEMEISRTVIHSVLEGGQGIVTVNAQTDPRFARQASVILYALRSILCSPLRVRGQVIGVVYVDHRAQANIFNTQDLEMLNAFAAQAAVAIENARLYTRTDQSLAARVDELETLAQIDQQLNQKLDYEHVLEVTRTWAVRGTGALDGWVAVEETGDGELVVAAGSGRGQSFRKDHWLIQESWKARKPHHFPAQGGGPARLVAPILHLDQPIGVVVVEKLQDFSEEKALFLGRLTSRAAMAISNARLFQAVQIANQTKSKFVSVVVHELRIPMTAIKGYADLLRQGAVGPVNETQLNFLDVIRNNVARMAALVSDLSDIARIETGRLKLDNQWLDVRKPLEEAASSMAADFAAKNQPFSLEIPEGLPQIYADSQRINQILTNLLVNAHKYTPEGKPISMKAHLLRPPLVLEPMVRIEVADSGIGISKDELGRVFNQFYRSDDPSVREQQGWGLGLNVARSLIEVMGGEIGVQSVLGEGSIFWFTLPTQAPASESAE